MSSVQNTPDQTTALLRFFEPENASRVFVSAEAGINHDGDKNVARAMVKASAEAGADAVKFQLVHAATLCAPSTDEQTRQMWKRVELKAGDFLALVEYARTLGTLCYASVFDSVGIAIAVEAGAPILKIASGEVTNSPLIEAAAETGIPVLMSVGMARLGEIEEAVEIILKRHSRLALLHCVANYPAAPQDLNLQRIGTLKNVFGLPVGYSDHSLSVWPVLAAVALGATFIEKHFTLDKNLPGADHALSATPVEMAEMVARINEIALALGSGELRSLACENEGRTLFRRSLHATRTIAPGERVEPNDIIALRPALGLAPGRIREVVGRRAQRRIEAGTPLTLDDFIQ